MLTMRQELAADDEAGAGRRKGEDGDDDAGGALGAVVIGSVWQAARTGRKAMYAARMPSASCRPGQCATVGSTCRP